MFSKILVANRGEIAVRIIRAARELGVRTVAVFSDPDTTAPFVRLADEAVAIGGATAAESYLNIEAVVAAARTAGAEAVHPGYGFLSENADFVRACTDAGLAFIGPTADVIALMGDKTRARDAAKESGVPLLPGSDGSVAETDLAGVAAEVGYPVVIKAAFGGGGRGMRVVNDPAELAPAAAAAIREATGAFGRPEVFVERYLPDARHIEVQVLGDSQGAVIAVGDRDCTIQRRHQKLMEEAPAPDVPEAVREQLHAVSVKLTAAVGYQGAGTVEFLYSPTDQEFYFLEMNTRLQVEHGVTELVTGIDLVREQILVAAGEPLSRVQSDVRINGHAIQARISAEDPWNGFLPNVGRLGKVVLPTAPWIRNDFGIESGGTIEAHYDSMVGKVLAWAPDRDTAADRLAVALDDLVIEGRPTTAGYLAQILHDPAYRSMSFSTDTVAGAWDPANFSPVEVSEVDAPAALQSVGGPRLQDRDVVIATDRGSVSVSVWGLVGTDTPSTGSTGRNARTRSGRSGGAARSSEPVSPMDATVVRIDVEAGQSVSKGAVLVIVEAMKMEMPIAAAHDCVVSEVLVAVGDKVTTGQTVVLLERQSAD